MNIYGDILNNMLSQINAHNYPGDYDTGLDLYESIAKLVRLVKDLNSSTINYSEKSEILDKKYTEILDIIKELKNKFAQKQSLEIPANFIEFYMLSEQLKKMLEIYVRDEVYKTAKFISFGISDDGKLFVDIPESWKDDVEFKIENEKLVMYVKEDYVKCIE